MNIIEETARTLLNWRAPRTVRGRCAGDKPITGEVFGRRAETSCRSRCTRIHRATWLSAWRNVPAPRRGEFVRLLGEELRSTRILLGRLVTIETGKIVSEGLGEVQEMIDICTFAAGLSRQLCGLTIASERPRPSHDGDLASAGRSRRSSRRLTFRWRFGRGTPLWRLVCGNSVVWKPSEKTPLTALATQAIFERRVSGFGGVPEGFRRFLIGGPEVGQKCWSKTAGAAGFRNGLHGNGAGGRADAGGRFGRSLLELGGNNAAIVGPSADLGLAVRGDRLCGDGHGRAALHYVAAADRA